MPRSTINSMPFFCFFIAFVTFTFHKLINWQVRYPYIWLSAKYNPMFLLWSFYSKLFWRIVNIKRYYIYILLNFVRLLISHWQFASFLTNFKNLNTNMCFYAKRTDSALIGGFRRHAARLIPAVLTVSIGFILRSLL